MSANSSWASGLGFSVTASLIGAGSKLCIRRSFTLLAEAEAAALVSTVDGSDYVPPKRSKSSSSSLSSSSAVIVEEEDEDDVLVQCPTPETLSEDEAGEQDSERGERVPARMVMELSSMPTSATTTTVHQYSPLLLQKLQAFALRALGMFGMMFLGPACNIYALQFASPSILSPVGGGLTLVWIILLSECTIGEKPRPRQIVAVGLIVVGEIIVALMGDHVNLYALSIDTMQGQYKEPRFLIYFTCMAAWMTFLLLLIRYSNSDKWRRFAWGVIGGSVTGMQNFIKDALAVVHGLDIFSSGSGAGGAVFNLPYLLFDVPLSLYALLLMAGIMPLAGLALLMACMKRYDATYSASMFMGSLVISASVMSAVHYHTFDHLSALQSCIYPMGLASMLSGTAILATETRLEKDEPTKQLHQQVNTDSSSDDEAETKQELLLSQEGGASIESYGSIEMA